MKYLLVIDTPIYRVSERAFAIDGALGADLRIFKQKLRGAFKLFTIVAPSYSAEEYERTKTALVQIDEIDEGIVAEPLPIRRDGKLYFWWHDARFVLPVLSRQIRDADLVHTELSVDFWRPLGFIALLLAIFRRKPSVLVVHFDFRKSATMHWLAKRWSLQRWLGCKFFGDSLRKLQVRIATRACKLVLFKSKRLVRDFGAQTLHIHEFLDASHSAEQIAPTEILAQRAVALCDCDHPLELVCFGQLADQNDIEETLRTLALVRERSALPFRFHIFGGGENHAHWQGVSEALRIARFVVFHDAVPLGPQRCEALEACHLVLATPMCEGMPRSAIDAMACGLPILAYGTDSYRELARKSGAVFLTPWNQRKRFSTALIEINKNRTQIADKAKRAVAFAKANTQEDWLGRRAAWTLQSMDRLPLSRH